MAAPENRQYPHNSHYLYDDEDVNGSPSLYVGLANSGVQRNEARRRRNRDELRKSAKPVSDLAFMNTPYFGDNTLAL